MARHWPPRPHVHKASGRLRVTIDGKHHYLGKAGTPEADQAYHRLIRDLERQGRGNRPGPEVPARGYRRITVTMLIARYDEHAADYYQKGGKPTRQLERVRRSLGLVERSYGDHEAAEFGPLALDAVRARMVGLGWTRRHINSCVGCIVRAWKWAASRELIPLQCWQALQAVEGLRKGRTSAPDRPAVLPPDAAAVAAVVERLPRVVADMVRLQRASAMRGGEICAMRPSEIQRGGGVWLYRPRDHKMEHAGRGRVVPLGPLAQEAIEPHLMARCPVCGVEDRRRRLGWRWTTCGPCADRLDDDGIAGPFPSAEAKDLPVFSPRETDRDRVAELRALRKSAVQPSQVCRRKAGARRKPGESYTSNSYAQAVRRACQAAGVIPWHPHALRHEAATRLRREYGVEVARIMLGHASLDATAIYAEADLAAAMDAAARSG